MGTTNPQHPRPHKVSNNDATFFFIDCADPFQVGTLIYNNSGSEGSTAMWGNVSAGNYTLSTGQGYSVILNAEGKSEIHTIS